MASEGGPWGRSYHVGEEFMADMGLDYVHPWGPSKLFRYWSVRDDGQDITGYELLVPSEFNNRAPISTSDPGKYSARLDVKGRTKGSPGLGSVPGAADSSLRARVCFSSLSVSRGRNIDPSAQHGSGYLMIDPTP